MYGQGISRIGGTRYMIGQWIRWKNCMTGGQWISQIDGTGCNERAMD